MDLREVGDRLEIRELLQRYATALDEKDYALLERVFVPGAGLHYALDEGSRSTYPQMVEAFRRFNERFLWTQHLLGEPLIELEGDVARSRTALRALHVQLAVDGERHCWRVYGVYRDALVRTPAGWRIRERRFQALHQQGTLLDAARVQRFASAPSERDA